MEKETQPSFVNNFDLIRVLAALQVVYRHMYMGTTFENKYVEILKEIIFAFPGVPVFFTVSGFLIYWSYERNSGDLKQFYRNRFLRIYPAMWMSIIITVIILLIFDEHGGIGKNLGVFFLWIAGQATFIQFWTPEFLKFWGAGFPNGSLWTISVELQFYLIIPIIFFITKRFSKFKILILTVLALCSLLFNHWISGLDRENILFKLGAVSVFYYLFYFLLGVVFYMYWSPLRKFFENKLILWLAVYLIAYYFIGNQLNINFYKIDRYEKVIFYVLLSCVILSFAFSYKSFSNKILHGNDLSYGIYVYHMVIGDFFYHFHTIDKNSSKIWVFVLTLIAAYLSWIFVEKRFMKLKKRTNKIITA